MMKAKIMILAIAAAAVAARGSLALAKGGSPSPAPLRVLTANVGNADILNCGNKYFYKLCLVEWEKKVADGIAKLSPDIVSLQEVLDVQWCEAAAVEKNKKNVCFRFEDRKERHQVRRLLGEDYTIVCDGRANYECIGVKKSAGTVEGCVSGELCRAPGWPLTIETPGGCSTKTVVFGVDAEIRGKRVRIVNGHPSAADAGCRAEELRRLFEGYEGFPALAVADRPAIIMGDMNMDPFQGDAAKDDVAVWRKHVGDGKEYYYLSGPAENDPPFRTCSGFTLDHVITNAARGSCVTLGQAPGTERLDGHPKGAPIQEAPDHFALLCEITLPDGD
ncbi:MAG TPA: hypothetical protein PLK80_06720 [bacterium]|nr:MAG: hypothetical protein BWY28_00195 [bacterium ADurb.Bin236]HOY64262.1 hypothetical protein [bacterium]HPI76411.1 hypothetical protein [bacterium]HPN95320.1 hypothetical protein [bacterium]